MPPPIPPSGGPNWEPLFSRKRGGKNVSLCFLAIFKHSLRTLPNMFPTFKGNQIRGKIKYFRCEKSTCVKKMSILLEIYKSHGRLRIFCKFSVFLLITPIFTNIFPVDLYRLQVYTIVDLIQIKKNIVIS